MEFFPRYVQKPAAMYTFLCDQDIPRAAYAQHTLLHSEAVVQADYWLEQRCPLAYLGCPFSVVRLRPNSIPIAHSQRKPARLAYMPTLNTFTVCYTAEEAITKSTKASSPGPFLAAAKGRAMNGTSTSICWLDLLPLEIMKKIIGLLDEVR